MTISRQRLELTYENEVIKNTEDIQTTVIPIGETWHLKRVTFADAAAPANNQSGRFKVDIGVDGGRETIAAAYLLADTFSFDIDRVFIGDGTFEIRVIRENLDNQDKFMFAFVEGFKRTGDIR